MPTRSTTSSAPSKTVLLTGFDPFGGATVNPSWQAVQSLHGERLLDHTVVAAQLPTVFGESLRCLSALLDAHRPALVICVGQAGGRGAISLERVAINVDDAPIADNAGARPIDAPVRPRAPAAYFTGLPIKAMLAELQAAGLAAEVSQTAGTFVCNHVFYGLMRTLATHRSLRHARGGFVHVPWLPEQGAPNMALDDIVRGLRLAVHTALRVRQDGALGAGATH
ncbi:pyroglutamyl-peptidase I [Hydrogenophaga sp. SNF1]|uniref:pyroglutamyl-peptidase I n=1 Tax=Hydrogenophaga sp. SNF1 TaxID=3098762 RepID=UPI002ACC25FD|nr:pyroglutamyl-peptidase I [Hydrogenophaga sp. SNF1]WQB85160.1 pyroglutamyl-peptidase I [Hydrogenophaga sp. SNF1]